MPSRPGGAAGRAVRGGENGAGRSAGAEPGVPPEVDLAVSRLERGDEGEGGKERGGNEGKYRG